MSWTFSQTTVHCSAHKLVRQMHGHIDMCINVKKSCCIRIGPRNDFGCANIITSTGLTLPWVREIRYLGSYLTAGRQLRCSVSYAKRYFYRATNAIHGMQWRQWIWTYLWSDIYDAILCVYGGRYFTWTKMVDFNALFVWKTFIDINFFVFQ